MPVLNYLSTPLNFRLLLRRQVFSKLLGSRL